jgi:ribulose-phosphate 3-epimerase
VNAFPIYPSLLSFDFACLGTQVAELAAAGAAGLHFDVMDGQFVPNLTFGPLVVKALRPITDLPFSAHLMVYTPEALIGPLADAGANRLYLHPESTPHIHRVLGQVRDAGLEVGVAINPGTPIIMLEPLLELVDGVLVMSVNPGFGGQSFLPTTFGRLAELRDLMMRHGVSPSVECDGGVDLNTIGPLARAGMTGAVVGTGLFYNGDPADGLLRLQQAAHF